MREAGGTIRDLLLASGEVGPRPARRRLGAHAARAARGVVAEPAHRRAGIVLSSRFAMWMAWGPELTFFCNDAYRRDTLGKKYPWALGRPAREVWAEIWPDIGPRIASVMRTGVATWDEALLLFLERGGFREETYHTFSYSPLTDDDGTIAGMLCVVSEESGRVIGERRMATLRELGSDPTEIRSEAEAIAVAGRHLEGNLHSLPFTLTYIFDEDGATRTCAARRGSEPGHPPLPPCSRRDDPDAGLAVRRPRRGRAQAAALDGRFRTCRPAPGASRP